MSILEFIKDHGFWGNFGFIWIALIFILFFYLIVHRTKNFPEDLEVVTYYSGYPGWNSKKEGRLQIGSDYIAFTLNNSSEFFKIPTAQIIDAEVKDEDQGLLALTLIGSTYGVVGGLQYLFVKYRNTENQEVKIQFAARTKANRLREVKDLIIKAKESLSSY